MRKEIFTIVCCILLQSCIDAQETCPTANRQVGTCIALRDCDPLYKLLATKPLTDEIRKFLARSQCAYRNGSPYVCCPSNAPRPTPQAAAKPYTGASGLTESDFPPPGACGVSVAENRIFGGNATGIYQYPWMAMLEYQKPSGTRGFHCGGVLIHQNYVLTASHCVNGKALVQARYSLVSVRLGEWNTRTDEDCNDEDICSPNPQNIPVAEIIPHESYQPNSQAQQDDIALLRLEYPATLTDFIRVICLPFDSSVRSKSYVGETMDVVGWGKTEAASRSDIKLKASVNGVSLEECNRVYNSQNVRIGSKQVCAGGERGVDSCNGDSGGPLMAHDSTDKKNPIYYLVGVVSFGPKQCGMEDWPGVYTRVGAYRDWILSHMRP